MSDAGLRGVERHNPAGSVIRDLLREAFAQGAAFAGNLSFRSWPYNLTLRGPMPDRFLAYPKDLQLGSGQMAQDLLAGRYAFPGGTVQANPSTAPWNLAPPSPTWSEYLHGFAWLAHLDGSQNERTKAHAHWLITEWIRQCGRWHNVGWRPHIIGQRLISWFCHARFITEETDLIWRSELMCSIARQAKHLQRTAKWAQEGERKLIASIGLTLSGLCLPFGERRLETGMTLLMQELDKQILADGGHVSRNPSVQLSTLVYLSALQELLEERNLPVPAAFSDTIGRMAPMLRFFRHNDGRLALFNGSNEERGGSVDAILAKTGNTKPFKHAPQSGFQRIKAGRTNLILDCGSPSKPEFSQRAHAGCLSFEMSVGRHRLVTNCGSTAVKGSDWLDASRGTAAHSTLCLAEESSARFLNRSLASRLLGPRIVSGPNQVVSERDENIRGVWVQTAHDGYLKRFGVWHERRLFLSANGEDLRGEDCLVAASEEDENFWRRLGSGSRYTQLPFNIRFHLHPDVKPSISKDGKKIILLLTNGDVWTFKTNAPAMALEDSIYLGSGTSIRRTRQIVLSGVAQSRAATATKWAFSRMARETGPNA